MKREKSGRRKRERERKERKEEENVDRMMVVDRQSSSLLIRNI